MQGDEGDVAFEMNKPRVTENSSLNKLVGIVEIVEYDSNDTVKFILDSADKIPFKLDDAGRCETFTNVTVSIYSVA